MRFEKIKSHAKVNLSLNVLGKQKSKLHNLETLVAFVDLHDQILIKRINDKNHEVKFSGCLLYTSPSPRDLSTSRMPSSA